MLIEAHTRPAPAQMLASVSLRTSMGSRRSELIGYLVEGTQGEPVCPPSFLKFRVR